MLIHSIVYLFFNLDVNHLIYDDQFVAMKKIMFQILFPFLLRRLKSEIVLDFPPKKEVMVYCPMTPLQMEMYKAVVDKSLANLLNTEVSKMLKFYYNI